MTYVRAFEEAEFDRRGAALRRRMEERGFDLLVCQDPANMNWLTGFDGWSFYTPQAVLAHRNEACPLWFGARPGCPIGGDNHLPARGQYRRVLRVAGASSEWSSLR